MGCGDIVASMFLKLKYLSTYLPILLQYYLNRITANQRFSCTTRMLLTNVDHGLIQKFLCTGLEATCLSPVQFNREIIDSMRAHLRGILLKSITTVTDCGAGCKPHKVEAIEFTAKRDYISLFTSSFVQPHYYSYILSDFIQDEGHRFLELIFAPAGSIHNSDPTMNINATNWRNMETPLLSCEPPEQ